MAEEQNVNRELVSASENAAISRAVLAWLNSCEEKPWRKIDFEYLGKTSGCCVSVVQAAYKIRQYITGGYKAQYQFQIVSRLIADTVDKRLSADEELDTMGEWAEKDTSLSLPGGIVSWKVKRDTASAIMARYDNNAEDHSISLTLTYEVI